MNLSITNAKKAECFTGLFQNIKIFTEAINIIFKKEKMYIQAMDNAHVSILEVDIPCNWFDKYELTEEKDIVIGVNVIILFRILNARNQGQNIEISYNDLKKDDELTIHLFGENKSDNFEKHFEIPLISLDREEMSIPEVDYEVEFSLPSVIFADNIADLQIFGDTMDIYCSEEKIVMTSISPDKGKASASIKIDDLSVYMIVEELKLNMFFSMKYLHNICAFNKLSKDVEIKLHNEYPLKVIYNISEGTEEEGEGEKAQVRFYLAPKINDD
jgi:proliferating cell nuclear antigen